MGRPVKYTEPRKDILLKLPLSLVEYLDSLAAQQNISRTELIYSILATSDTDTATKLIKTLNETRKQLSHLIQENKKLNESLSKLDTRFSSIIKLYQPLDIPEEIFSFCEQYKHKVKTIDIDVLTDVVLREFENKKLSEGFKITKKQTIRQMIKASLLQLKDEVIR